MYWFTRALVCDHKKANFRLLGKVVDFSPEGNSEKFEFGIIRRGSGGLSYRNKQDLENKLLPTINNLAKEYQIPFGTTEKYSSFATIDNDQAEKITKKANSLFFESYKATFYVIGFVFAILAIWLLIDLTSLGFTIYLFLLIGALFFAYKKYIKK